MLRLISSRRILGFKIETTPYTGETLTASDYGYSVYDIDVSPSIESYGRKLARAEYSHDVSIAGRRTGEIKWKVDLYHLSSMTTPPRYFDMLRACGLSQTIGAGGVSLTTSTNGRVPATIEVAEPQEGATPDWLVWRFTGCMGTARLTCDSVGKPIRIEFTFRGAFAGVSTRAYASQIIPASFDTAIPPAVLAATINLFGTWLPLSKFTIDLGNDIELFDEASSSAGVSGARVTGRRVVAECDPDIYTTSVLDYYSPQIWNQTGELTITVGAITISAPAAQIIDAYKPESRQGHSVHQMKLELQRSNGNDELTIKQGS